MTITADADQNFETFKEELTEIGFKNGLEAIRECEIRHTDEWTEFLAGTGQESMDALKNALRREARRTEENARQYSSSIFCQGIFRDLEGHKVREAQDAYDEGVATGIEEGFGDRMDDLMGYQLEFQDLTRVRYEADCSIAFVRIKDGAGPETIESIFSVIFDEYEPDYDYEEIDRLADFAGEKPIYDDVLKQTGEATIIFPFSDPDTADAFADNAARIAADLTGDEIGKDRPGDFVAFAKHEPEITLSLSTIRLIRQADVNRRLTQAAVEGEGTFTVQDTEVTLMATH